MVDQKTISICLTTTVCVGVFLLQGLDGAVLLLLCPRHLAEIVFFFHEVMASNAPPIVPGIIFLLSSFLLLLVMTQDF